VNGALRQQAHVSEQIWDLDAMLAQVWARRDTTWEHRGARAALFPAAKTIPARTLLLSGTPAGTVFQGVGTGARLSGVLAWLFGGWGTPLPNHVVEAYIREAKEAGLYLRPGDRVTIHVDRLGMMENEITP
jgi:2-keto-4-pentenoate hydratase/2-oxohepta-3-ene-1,7-dioic acid hydratase in catechol pathway